MQQKLDSKTAYNLLIDGIIKEEKDFKKDQNKWILHSIYCGLAAERIAKALNCYSFHGSSKCLRKCSWLLFPFVMFCLFGFDVKCHCVA